MCSCKDIYTRAHVNTYAFLINVLLKFLAADFQARKLLLTRVQHASKHADRMFRTRHLLVQCSLHRVARQLPAFICKYISVYSHVSERDANCVSVYIHKHI